MEVRISTTIDSFYHTSMDECAYNNCEEIHTLVDNMFKHLGCGT